MYIYIDVYKIYSYPLSNFFRLSKTFTRTQLLMKYYPIEYDTSKAAVVEADNPYTQQVLDVLKQYQSVILIDVYAYNFFMSKARLSDKTLKEPYLVCISTRYREDVNEVYKDLKQLHNNVMTREFYPFLDHLGRRQDFYIEENGKRFMLVQIYSEVGTCIPYRMDGNGHKVGTTQLVLLYLMVTRQKMLADYYSTKNHRILEKVKIREKMIMNMKKAREAYIAKHGNTSLFKKGDPFEEFVIDCEGDSVTPIRQKSLRINQRISEKKPLRYRYVPGRVSPGLDKLWLEDFMGSEIKKDSNKTLK
jgi:hypothetical protein